MADEGSSGILAFEAPQAVLRRASSSELKKVRLLLADSWIVRNDKLNLTAALFQGDARQQQGRDLLDSVIAPRSFEKNGTQYMQRAALTPATRQDVINVQVSLGRKQLPDPLPEADLDCTCPPRENSTSC